MSQNILIIGASSAIAEAVARHYAPAGASFFLAGRNREKLDAIASDLSARGAAQATPYILDLNESSAHTRMIEAAWQELERVDTVLIAYGTLPDQVRCQEDVDYAINEFQTNGLGVIALLTPLANRMEEQGSGNIAVISSVAGDRGRPSNYLYGAAKGALTIYLQGLRARLAKKDIHVLTIKPGFVATPMTAELELPKRLLTTPERVAKDIARALDKQKNTLYTPWFWWWIMLIIRNIPEKIFKKLDL